jgi:hypothetical protein
VTVRVIDDALFAGKQPHPDECGPKGIDVDSGSNLLAVTSEHQPLAFFSLPALLAHASRPDHACDQSARELRAAEVCYELETGQLLRTRELEAEARADRLSSMVSYMWNSRSWRMTAPLRRLDALLRRWS